MWWIRDRGFPRLGLDPDPYINLTESYLFLPPSSHPPGHPGGACGGTAG